MNCDINLNIDLELKNKLLSKYGKLTINDILNLPYDYFIVKPQQNQNSNFLYSLYIHDPLDSIIYIDKNGINILFFIQENVKKQPQAVGTYPEDLYFLLEDDNVNKYQISEFAIYEDKISFLIKDESFKLTTVDRNSLFIYTINDATVLTDTNTIYSFTVREIYNYDNKLPKELYLYDIENKKLIAIVEVQNIIDNKIYVKTLVNENINDLIINKNNQNYILIPDNIINLNINNVFIELISKLK